MTGRHDLIGSSRSVEIFAAALGSSTSGSKAYFLFKLHDPTSGESGRQEQLTTRLSSCILDMCEILFGKIKVAVKYIMNVCNPYNIYNSQLSIGKTDKAEVTFDH